MSCRTMSLGDFANLCKTRPGCSFLYSSEGKANGRFADLRICFTGISVSLCPDIVVLTNEAGDSMTIRDVTCVHIERGAFQNIDRIMLDCGGEPGCVCEFFLINRKKYIDKA